MRILPRVGSAATVSFLAAKAAAVIVRVDCDGASVDVRTIDGDTHTFTLSPATGRWVTAAGQSGPRLRLSPDD